jgi:hypothetical protein
MPPSIARTKIALAVVLVLVLVSAATFLQAAGEWQIDLYRATAPSLPAEFVPVSDNGCGDFYGFLVSNGGCESRVVFADHEAGYALEATDLADLYEYIERYGFHAA